MSKFHVGQKVTVERGREVLAISKIDKITADGIMLANGTSWASDGTTQTQTRLHIRPYATFDDQVLARWKMIRALQAAGDIWERIPDAQLARVYRLVEAHSHPEVDPSYE